METFRGLDRSKWSLADFIQEGEMITWNAQETETLETRDTFLAPDVHDRFMLWYLGLKEFLTREGYFLATHPHFSTVSPLQMAGKVPRLIGTALVMSGRGYGDPRSKESQTLFGNIREEAEEILSKLRIIATSTPQNASHTAKPPTYDAQTRVLVFLGTDILISSQEDTNPSNLLRVIFNDISKLWPNDEILENWYGENIVDSKAAIKKMRVYQAGRAVNSSVEKKTSVGDFLKVTMKAIRVNQKYL